MKKILLALLVALPFAAQSGWLKPDGSIRPDTASMRSSGDFGASLVLTPDAEKFRHTWNSTTGKPSLTSTDKLKIGSFISGVLIFTGCQPGANKACDVTVEFTLKTPSGKIEAAGNGPVWKSLPPKTRILYMGDASVTMDFDKTDELGTYTLIANVIDKNSKRKLLLSAPFKLSK